MSNKALIESSEHPLGDTRGAVVGAQVKSIRPHTEDSVKDLARRQAMEAMPFGGKSLTEILADLTKSILGGITSVVKTIANGAAFVVDAAFSAIGGLLQSIFNALGDLIKPMQRDIETGLSGQIALNDRIDLLNDVSGYVCAYQTVNIDGAWSNRNTRDLPFKSQIGPAKNAHIDTQTGMIVLDAKGLWTFNARCHCDNTIFGGDDYCHMKLLVYTPEGKLFHEVHEAFETPRSRENTLILSTEPVVVDRPGYKAKIQIYMDNWRVFKGGTKYSSFSAVRHSNEVIHMGQQTVGSEAD